MPIDIVVPDLGESITEATVAAWFKKPGDPVAADETLLELETDKATLEVPAPSAGVLSEILVAEGEDVEVGAVLGRIEVGATVQSTEAGLQTEAAGAAATEAEEAAAEAEAPPAPGGPQEPGLGAAAPEPVLEASTTAPSGLDPASIERSGPGGRVTLADLQRFFERASREAVERSGPAVRKLIADYGLDSGQIPASGPGGRITKEDVLGFLAGAESATSVPTPAPEAEAAQPALGPAAVAPSAAAGPRREERVRMSRLRRTIAARLKEAQNTAAILTTFNEADMSGVIELRREYRDAFEQKHGVRLGFMSFFVKAAVAALKEVPEVNASIEGDEVVYKHYYDIGIAVSTDAGLKVPVVRDCDRKSFAEIEKEIADLAARARDGTLSLEEMEGGTFSVTNGGVFGSLLSTPILNPPQSAILGLHKIQERAVVMDAEVRVRPMMYLALSYDHRLIDGREAVKFLVRVKELIENPSRLVLDV